jgi:Asp-tRNA(Asn)/Glu-tRNA(Gln) amidotransferase A subunit family amidase
MEAKEPSQLTVTEAAAAIRRGELTPLELARSCIDRIERVDPEIRAWVTVDRAGALREAETLTQAARAGEFRGPLHGVPIGIKDIFHAAGMRTTAGHMPMADFVADYDSAVVERLRRAGAIILGKTTTTELALMAPAATRNPWNLAHTPGGSSSGSAAAVAARMCPAAIGSQTGGSTLRPAAYCGIVGFKPTHGRISAFGMIPLAHSTDCPGILARGVADVALLLQALAGWDSRDHTSARAPVDDYRRGHETPPAQPRIALMMGGDFSDKSDAETIENVRAAADQFSNEGARIEQIAPPASYARVAGAFWKILAAEPAAYHRAALTSRPESFDPRTREFLEKGLSMSAVGYLDAIEVQRQFRREVAEILRHCDAILAPSTPSAAPGGLESTGDPSFNNPWSLSGNPVAGLPSRLTTEGLPMAVQLVGATFREAQLLGIARWCERALAFERAPALAD